MPRRTPLDPRLGTAFRVADARERGHSASRLRGADLERPHHGVRTTTPASTPLAAARAYAPLLRPGDRFSGPTAAALWGAPLPDDTFPLHVTAGLGLTRPRRPGVVGHRCHVESRRETLLRLLVRAAGLPEPRCGMLVHDRDGREIGYFDLVWPEHRVIAEYDGDQHRTSTYQYDRDIRRFDRATEAGYRVIRVRARGLGPDRAETLIRIRRALTR